MISGREIGAVHKLLTYIEYRAVCGVFRTIDPPPPLHPARVSSPRTKSGGVHTPRAVRGWGVNNSEDASHWIGLLQYNPSTELSVHAHPYHAHIHICVPRVRSHKGTVFCVDKKPLISLLSKANATSFSTKRSSECPCRSNIYCTAHVRVTSRSRSLFRPPPRSKK